MDARLPAEKCPFQPKCFTYSSVDTKANNRIKEFSHLKVLNDLKIRIYKLSIKSIKLNILLNAYHKFKFQD